jgi:predicted nucleotidyltransferase
MTQIVGQVLAELKSHLVALYGERLKGVYLFGSHARGDADDESDVDVLIVLDRVEHYSREISQTSEVVSELALKYGISLSRFFASETQWRDDSTNFFLNVREEALPA